MAHLLCEGVLKMCHNSLEQMLNRNITALDWRKDKSTLLECSEGCFTAPISINFIPAKDDMVSSFVRVARFRLFGERGTFVCLDPFLSKMDV